jgi:uncharacterized protein
MRRNLKHEPRAGKRGTRLAECRGAMQIRFGGTIPYTHERPMTWMIYLAIGLGAGVLAGMFGIGGGIVIIPLLVFATGMDQQTAQGTSLGALLLPVGVFGALYYYRNGHMNVQAAMMIGLGLLVATGAGAWLNLRMTPEAARRVFAVFLALIAVRMWFR